MLAEVRATVYAVLALAGALWAGYELVLKRNGYEIASPAQVVSSLKDIIKGAPSAALSIIKGESDNTYITTAQQRQQAEANLARKRLVAGNGGA